MRLRLRRRFNVVNPTTGHKNGQERRGEERSPCLPQLFLVDRQRMLMLHSCWGRVSKVLGEVALLNAGSAMPY
jgi:hypothetical protein